MDKREPTPPAQCKRMLARPVREPLPSPDDTESPGGVLGDGQFDRFSSTRRTRRFKRQQEVNGDASPELVAEKEIIRPRELQIQASYPVAAEGAVTPTVEKESRLKQWQDRLKVGNRADIPPTKTRTRNQTGIHQDDVRNALRLAKPVTDVGKGENRIKTKEHNDNDEGFEETQSLMSESPSQAASSGSYLFFL